jgi:hypothetical protein
MLAIWYFIFANYAVRNADTASYSFRNACWIEMGIVDKSGNAALPVSFVECKLRGQIACTQTSHSDEVVLNI